VDLASYAVTAITPKARVTANEWSGPKSRPIQPIQQTSYAHPPAEFQFESTTGDQLLSPFGDRAAGYPGNIKLPVIAGQLRALPKNYSPWWDAVVNRPMRADLPSLTVDVESLILNAIEHSPQVTAMRIDPVLRETVIVEEEAEFDWTAFLETTYDDKNDPVGNTLTLGPSGDTRYEDRNLYGQAGLRKRLGQGGEVDVTSRAGYQRTNSSFFVPGQQGTTRLEVNFTQPLLRGAGQIYNESRIVLASIDRNVSEDELAGRMQDHLVDVYKTYWTLYRARAVKLQKQRLLQRAIEIEKHLKARQGIDAIRRQVLRANAAVASRRSEIVRADMAIRNAESQLRLLVNSPDLKKQAQVELLPAELPLGEHLDISLRASIETALQHRPEIAKAIRKMKATSVRLGISRNELLPKLDVVLGAYIAGLKGNGDVPRSLGSQFADGRPGYTVGLMFEFPLGNRAARARNERRQWEVAKAFREFEAAVESGMTDVELAVRELETSYQEMLSRFQAMLAAETEANYLMERWRLLPGSDQTISFLLEDLLDAQERVADEEAAFVNAQSAYVLSIVELKRATGVLLDCDCDTGAIAAPGIDATYVPPPDRTGARPPTVFPRPLPREPQPRQPLQPLRDALPLPAINN
jgi:outer membrane protein TolC